ncbi:MAG: dihydrodipicolinate synthase family protein [Gemmatimonadota bacterium]|nr:dihydrodipicolinate synthase family protein [Gemmatimonadota bacterium]
MAGLPFRGVFVILATPFSDDGSLDEDGLQSVVEFSIAAGAHGLVSPANASEFSALSDPERLRVIEVIARAARGRLPFVAGVSGVSAQVAVWLAKHAADAGADAVIAMPPYVAKPPVDGVRAYYDALSRATELPIFVQNYPLPIGVPMSAALLGQLALEIERVIYIKEEVPPVTHSVSADIEACGDSVAGVFGGAAGRFMLDEMRRGATGTMPACDVPDVHAAVWDAWQAGDAAGAREVFNRLLPLLNFEMLYSVTGYKEVLRRRGVIRSARVRTAATGPLDAHDHAELDAILADIRDLWSV